MVGGRRGHHANDRSRSCGAALAAGAVLARALFCAVLYAIAVAAPAQGSESLAVTIDDLATRAQIILAAISHDGRYAAYLIARGNPAKDAYEMTLEVADTQVRSEPVKLASYELGGSEVFDDGYGVRPSAGFLYWTARGELLFTEKAATKMRVALWTPGSARARVILDGHDKIALDDDDRVQSEVKVLTRDIITPSIGSENGVMDYAWRMTDQDRFYGERPNLNQKTGPFVQDQKWSVSFDRGGKLSVKATGAPEERWERDPAGPLFEKPFQSVGKSVDTESEEVFPYGDVASPSGRRVAFVQSRTTNRNRPGEVDMQMSIAVSSDGTEGVVVPPAQWHRVVLGWAADDGPIYFLETRHEGSVLKRVTLRGHVSEITKSPALFEKPCGRSRQCQFMSAEGRRALLVRSTNTTPHELVLVDLGNGAVRTLAAPNAVFQSKKRPEVRFHEIESLHGKSWGRLYLPTDYKAGTRYPLVVTLYVSTPGFYASVGDEVPILPLTANGIAVFAMDATNLWQGSASRDFRVELARVEVPLRGLRWIIEKLTEQGIIDAKRVGITGLSYGSEVAGYAHGKTNLFAAASTASASWHPSHFVLGGPAYAAHLLRRGFTSVADEQGLENWRRLSVSFDPRPDLSPLLIQTSDGEEVFTGAGWTELRLAGAPVEWYSYPEAEAGHVKTRPANKWWVYRRNLDWFRFWLQDYEDPATEKAEQYSRWRAMREKHSAASVRRR